MFQHYALSSYALAYTLLKRHEWRPGEEFIHYFGLRTCGSRFAEKVRTVQAQGYGDSRPRLHTYIIYIYIYIHMYMHACMCMYVYVCIHMYVCVYIYIYMHMHILSLSLSIYIYISETCASALSCHIFLHGDRHVLFLFACVYSLRLRFSACGISCEG